MHNEYDANRQMGLAAIQRSRSVPYRTPAKRRDRSFAMLPWWAGFFFVKIVIMFNCGLFDPYL